MTHDMESQAVTLDQPDTVRVRGDEVRVGHWVVIKNPKGDGTWLVERVREIYQATGDTVTFGLGPVGHAARTVFNAEKIAITRQSAETVGTN